MFTASPQLRSVFYRPSLLALLAALLSAVVLLAGSFGLAMHQARQEGLLGGITSGANIWAAMQRAKALGPGKRVVTVVIDTGLRYLNSGLYP